MNASKRFAPPVALYSNRAIDTCKDNGMDTVAKHEESFDIKGFFAFQGPGGADLPSAFRLRPAPVLHFRGRYKSVGQLWSVVQL